MICRRDHFSLCERFPAGRPGPPASCIPAHMCTADAPSSSAEQPSRCHPPADTEREAGKCTTSTVRARVPSAIMFASITEAPSRNGRSPRRTPESLPRAVPAFHRRPGSRPAPSASAISSSRLSNSPRLAPAPAKLAPPRPSPSRANNGRRSLCLLVLRSPSRLFDWEETSRRRLHRGRLDLELRCAVLAHEAACGLHQIGRAHV